MALLDLYSCFPVAPQLAARILGIPYDGSRALSATGGLPYFGGSGNNYALHAIATMVSRLREMPDALGLVSALGWYLTKHAVGIYGTRPPDRDWTRRGHEQEQQAIDARPRPQLATEVTGRGTVETYTIVHDREGMATEGIVIVRVDDGRRVCAGGALTRCVCGLRARRNGGNGRIPLHSDGRTHGFRPSGA